MIGIQNWNVIPKTANLAARNSMWVPSRVEARSGNVRALLKMAKWSLPSPNLRGLGLQSNGAVTSGVLIMSLERECAAPPLLVR